MLTQPPATMTTLGSEQEIIRVSVTEDQWKFYGPQPDCLTILGRVLQLCPDAAMYDGMSEQGGDQAYEPTWHGYAPPDIDRVWKIKATFAAGEKTLAISEFAGWLHDRLVQPSSLDPNGTGPLGGPYLVVRDVGATDAAGNAIGELHWAQNPPQTIGKIIE